MPLDDDMLYREIRGISGRLEGFANDLLKAVKLLVLFMQGYRGSTPALAGKDNDGSAGSPRSNARRNLGEEPGAMPGFLCDASPASGCAESTDLENPNSYRTAPSASAKPDPSTHASAAIRGRRSVRSRAPGPHRASPAER